VNTRATFNNLALPYTLYQNGQNQSFNRDRPAEDNSRREVQARVGDSPSDFVFRGEFLDATDNEKRYRQQFNQQIAPQNRAAIEVYQTSESLLSDSDPRGRLLDRFI